MLKFKLINALGALVVANALTAPRAPRQLAKPARAAPAALLPAALPSTKALIAASAVRAPASPETS